MNREQKLKTYIMKYPLEVPNDMLENELNYIQLELRHRMQYDTLTGGPPHINPAKELADMKDELHQAAYYEAKYQLVIKDILAKQNFSITRKELEDEAIAIAQRQNSTLDMVYRFFEEELAMLEQDIKRQKAEQWILDSFME